jgi:uncharacterized protein YcbK (DUF882 family)
MSVARTKYFALSEWNSKHPLAEPYPAQWVETRWRPLAQMLDKIRERLGEPIRVTPSGGYRPAAMNRAISGALNSRHTYGDAADIQAKTWSAKRLHALIVKMYQEGAIPELGGLGLYDYTKTIRGKLVRIQFVHVDTRPRIKGHLARWQEVGVEARQQEA